MDLTLICFFLVIVPPLNCGVVTGKGRSLQISSMYTPGAQDLPSKDPVRHGRKKKLKSGSRRERRRHKGKNGLSKVYTEKEYLVHNRTIELLGDEVQRILNSAKTLAVEEAPVKQKKSKTSEKKRAGGLSGEVNRNKVQTSLRSNSFKFLTTTITTNESNVSIISNNNRTASFTQLTRHLDLEIINKNTTKEDYLDLSTLRVEEKPINFNTAIKYFIEALTNYTTSNISNFNSPCDKWVSCRGKLQEIFLGPLPACPCKYPSGIFYDDKLWDESEHRFYRWKDASGDSERLDIFKPGAEYCIRSLLSHTTNSLSVQHCCYDRDRKLLTRGSGAGNPNYVSPDVSKVLHDKLDLLPWRLCKGDFTKYNLARPPNNGNSCKMNPNDAEYERQVNEALSF